MSVGLSFGDNLGGFSVSGGERLYNLYPYQPPIGFFSLIFSNNLKLIFIYWIFISFFN